MTIKDKLCSLGISPIDMDIPYIKHILRTIQQAESTLYPYKDLHKEVPIVVVDPGVIKNE